MNLPVLARSYQGSSLLLVNTVNVGLLVLDQILCDVKVTQLACNTQGRVIVKVLHVYGCPTLDQCLDNGELATAHGVVKRCVFVRADTVNI